MGLWDNDEARQFFRDNGLPEQYNDGMREYLRQLLGSTQSLPDLMRRFYTTYGNWDFVALTPPTASYSLTDGALDAAFTFTRASTAYYHASDGTLTSAAIDTPRFDYNPTTLEIKGLLIEEAATNLFLQSQTFDNASWIKNSSTVTADATTAPDGTLTADEIVENTATNTHGVQQSNVTTLVPVGTTYTFSVYVKAGSGTRRIQFLFAGSAFSPALYSNFNFSTETLTLGSGVTGTYTKLPNGWFRITVMATTNVDASAINVFIRLANSDAAAFNSYTGDGTSSIYVWGAQFELGSVGSSYIPTVAATASRSADVLSITGANFSGFWNATEGVVKIVGIQDGKPTGTFISINDGTTNEEIFFEKTSTNVVRWKITDGGVSTYEDVFSGIMVDNTLFKAAIGYKLNDSASAVNGTVSPKDTAVTLPTVTQVQFSGQVWWLRDFIYYNVKLSDGSIRGITNGV